MITNHEYYNYTNQPNNGFDVNNQEYQQNPPFRLSSKSSEYNNFGNYFINDRSDPLNAPVSGSDVRICNSMAGDPFATGGKEHAEIPSFTKTKTRNSYGYGNKITNPGDSSCNNVDRRSVDSIHVNRLVKPVEFGRDTPSPVRRTRLKRCPSAGAKYAAAAKAVQYRTNSNAADYQRSNASPQPHSRSNNASPQPRALASAFYSPQPRCQSAFEYADSDVSQYRTHTSAPASRRNSISGKTRPNVPPFPKYNNRNVMEDSLEDEYIIHNDDEARSSSTSCLTTDVRSSSYKEFTTQLYSFHQSEKSWPKGRKRWKRVSEITLVSGSSKNLIDFYVSLMCR